jgi:hypothetical protein
MKGWRVLRFSPSTRTDMKPIAIILVALSLIIVAGVAGGRVLERNREIAEMQALRASLSDSRFAADSCKAALSWEQEGFLAFDRMVDSLRTRMESYQDPERGGVPQEEYQEYLESFELYNDSVGVWQLRADGLREKESACRVLVEAHNFLSDSIRRRQEAMREGTR